MKTVGMLGWVAMVLLGGVVCTATSATTTATHARVAAPAARIRPEAARAVAKARFPNGKIKSEELEREGGRWVYSYDIAVPGRPGIEEVWVDAITGKITSVKYESPKTERRERELERRHIKGR